MNIVLRCNAEDATTLTKEAMDRIDDVAGKPLEWKISTIGENKYCEASCYRNVEEIDSLFNKLIKDIPELEISGSYNVSCREDDYSADWWTCISISTVIDSDGTKRMERDSATYWN